MKDYKLIIFDLDGTLLDTSEGILASVRYTIDAFGFAKLPEEKLWSFIGPPIQDSFRNAYGLEGSVPQDMATVFRDRYKTKDLLLAVPYPGIFDALKALKAAGKKLAVATYKREDYALDILHYFGFDRYFDVMHGADHENRLKKADILDMCMRETGSTPRDQTLLVGDTLNDSVGAEKAGIDFLAVSYGFGFHGEKDLDSIRCIGLAAKPEDISGFCI